MAVNQIISGNRKLVPVEGTKFLVANSDQSRNLVEAQNFTDNGITLAHSAFMLPPEWSDQICRPIRQSSNVKSSLLCKSTSRCLIAVYQQSRIWLFVLIDAPGQFISFELSNLAPLYPEVQAEICVSQEKQLSWYIRNQVSFLKATIIGADLLSKIRIAP